MYLLSVPSVSSRYFNKIKRTPYLGKLPALSLKILRHFPLRQHSSGFCSFSHKTTPHFSYVLKDVTHLLKASFFEKLIIIILFCLISFFTSQSSIFSYVSTGFMGLASIALLLFFNSILIRCLLLSIQSLGNAPFVC